MATTREQVKAALKQVLTIAEVIREAGEIPSGHVYAAVMGVMDLDQYQQIIGLLQRNGLVKQDRSYLLHWTGGTAQ